MLRSEAIWRDLDGFLRLLYGMTGDVMEVRKVVCQSFNSIVEIDAMVLVGVLESVVKFMLDLLPTECGLESADFFLLLCGSGPSNS